MEEIKGTVRVFASDPPCKDDNARFTTETALSGESLNQCISSFKLLIFVCGYTA